MSYFNLVVVLLMSIRVLKESLIAAAELDMIGGEYVFLAFEIDVAAGLNRQKLPFKWTTADFGMYFDMNMSKWIKMVSTNWSCILY